MDDSVLHVSNKLKGSTFFLLNARVLLYRSVVCRIGGLVSCYTRSGVTLQRISVK